MAITKSKLRVTLLCLPFVLFSSSLFAQLSAAGYNKDEMQTFLKTKTYLILTADSVFNNEAIKGMKEFWKVTKWDTISESRITDKINTTENSFLYLTNIIRITQQKDQYGKVLRQYSDIFKYFALLNGGKTIKDNLQYSDLLAFCPINHEMDEQPMYSSGYRAASMVCNINGAVKLVMEKEIKGNSYKVVKALQDIYEEKAKAIKGKTLLVNKEHLKDLDEETFKKYYTFPIEFCDAAKFKSAYRKRDKKYMMFQPAVIIQKSIFVIDAETRQCLYFGDDMMRLKLDKGDIKDLAKAVGKD